MKNEGRVSNNSSEFFDVISEIVEKELKGENCEKPSLLEPEVESIEDDDQQMPLR